jgi:hypothetical protein
MGPVEGSCEHVDEPSGSIKCLEILQWLSDWWLLKKDSAPWSSFDNEARSLHLSLESFLRSVPKLRDI